jgi:hypothetical protein
MDAAPFLIGEWVGEGGGMPGQGGGGFSFLPDQDGRILIRKNYANYPATKDKPAYSHTDLTIICEDSGETKLATALPAHLCQSRERWGCHPI